MARSLMPGCSKTTRSASNCEIICEIRKLWRAGSRGGRPTGNLDRAHPFACSCPWLERSHCNCRKRGWRQFCVGLKKADSPKGRQLCVNPSPVILIAKAEVIYLLPSLWELSVRLNIFADCKWT